MNTEDWKLNSYDYDLPKNLIAQYPSPSRDQSRMLLIERKSGKISDKKFSDIINIIPSSSCLVVNNTKVIPARINGKRKTGGKIEALLIDEIKKGKWKAMVNKSKRIKIGERIDFCEGEISAVAQKKLNDGEWIFSFDKEKKMNYILEKYGLTPLPPYIQRDWNNEKYSYDDRNRYQTCFASEPGAIASPTAGLHFTPEIISEIKKRGIEILEVTLHVGLGTFKSIKTEDIREHKMHAEFFSVSKQTIDKIRYFKKNNKKILSIGTTSLRVLETLAQKNFEINSGWTDIFIHSPYKFQITDGLLTNFHLPKSTLIILVSAFCGRKFLLNSYKKAVSRNYRFFSYGDCMMIL